MRNYLALILVFVFISVSGFASAQNSVLPDAGVLPDSPFYFLKSWWEKIQLFFTFDAEKKAEQYLRLAEVRLVEYQKMIEKGKLEIAEQTFKKYENQLNRALGKAEQLKTKSEKKAEEMKIKIKEATIKHLEVLRKNLTKVPEAAKKGLEKAIEASQKMIGVKEVITKEKEIPTVTSPSVDTSNWQTYRNEQYEFEIRYPHNFKLAIESGGVISLSSDFTTIYLRKIEEKQANISLLSHLKESKGKEYYDKVLGVTISDFSNFSEENLSGYRIVKADKFTFESCPANSYWFPKNEKQYLQIDVIKCYKPGLYSGNLPLDQQEEKEKEVESILSTFKFFSSNFVNIPPAPYIEILVPSETTKEKLSEVKEYEFKWIVHNPPTAASLPIPNSQWVIVGRLFGKGVKEIFSIPLDNNKKIYSYKWIVPADIMNVPSSIKEKDIPSYYFIRICLDVLIEAENKKTEISCSNKLLSSFFQ